MRRQTLASPRARMSGGGGRAAAWAFRQSIRIVAWGIELATAYLLFIYGGVERRMWRRPLVGIRAGLPALGSRHAFTLPLLPTITPRLWRHAAACLLPRPMHLYLNHLA